MVQMSFFSSSQGEALREQAIERVERNASEDFMSQAALHLRSLAVTRATFTTDDLWAELHLHGVPRPREPRAMGAVMRKGESLGWITATDQHVLSKRPACHRRPLRVWSSLLVQR